MTCVPTFLLLLGQTARALPGTHAPAVSSYDTRASSVVLAYRHGSSDAGAFNTVSYNANFSSSTGRLSAQFGLHYVNFGSKINDSTAHGVGASGVALFLFPVAGRYPDGTPKVAVSFDVGAVPTAYVSGQRNYLTMPLVLGFAVPMSPHPAITFVPWFEAAPSANLDTVFKRAAITLGQEDVNIDIVAGTASLNQNAVEAAVRKGVSVDLSFAVPMRAGLDADIHLSDSADFDVHSAFTTLGGGFRGTSVLTLGAGLTFRWDDIVPAVLPVERRLERESCDAVEGRFRSCPSSTRWLSPEQRARPQAPNPPLVGHAPAATLPPPRPAVVTPRLTPAPAPPVIPSPPSATPSSEAPKGASSPSPSASAAFPN